MIYSAYGKRLMIAATAFFFLAYPIQAAELRVATASNFIHAMKALTHQFESISDHTITIINGSTGKHYAQIINGAPFDIFFAADTERPQMLETNRDSVPNTRFTYAIGQLILWSPEPNLVVDEATALRTANFHRLAIANPKLAPYGKAAQETLQSMELWKSLSKRIVRGENINQTMHFVQSGNATLGLVALSQVQQPDIAPRGSLWKIPQDYYAPIEQQAILLKDSPTARAFLRFVASKEGKAIIRGFGYKTQIE